jgi:hypothetical protein
MAKIKITTRNKIVAVFQSRELARYGPQTAYIERYAGMVYVNYSLPFLTWHGNDVRVIEDLIEALKLIGNSASKVKGEGAGGWTGSAHPPTINHSLKIRYPVYAKHSDPHVQIERVNDFVKWSVDGHFFKDDIPSMRAYVAALTQLRDKAKTI